MAQKNKVKELVGRGLHSYHTKALQQMDRIEKKNKEQNHKISILTNELDNDYLTKTEEGSVVSLEHSKEGMVYLDELQGNTLVNYCSDGSKELTLNGDIDVEGTFVTTTEGVDNGLVDVACEGNTLVNCIQPLTLSSDFNSFSGTIEDGYLCFSASGSYKNYFVKKDKFIVKPSTTYTFVVDIKENTLVSETTEHQFVFGNSQVGTPTYWTGMYWISRGTVGRKVFTLTTRDYFDDVELGDRGFITNTCTSGNLKFKYMILEGDWTNKEVPSEYFEGMKSVGQDDTNGHKFEILSHNGNLYKRLENSHYKVYGSTVTIIEENENGFIYKAEEWDMGLSYLISTEGLFKNKKYRLSWEGNNNTPNAPLLHSDGIKLLDSNKSFKEIISWDDFDYLEYDFKLPDSFEQGDILEIRFKNGALSVENGACNICINEIGVAKNTVISKLNKKEILLNEPLRSLPNGIKDRFVKIGGKWFIERNCDSYTFNGSENGWTLREHKSEDYCTYSIVDTQLDELFKYAYIGTSKAGELVCDKLIALPIIGGVSEMYSKNYQCTALLSNASTNSGGRGCYINVALSSLGSKTFTQWLSENNITIIFKRLNPIYEPLEVEPILSMYNDIAHISNNSIIPCSMKIKNTGYNAIIKPSTLYTIALDANKSGTIGMNLGGAKGTTTNNVLTLTTPATLTDDSLRLYGKGIKGSKVRLLEGDKTNWIPSFFEGMKSSFEDKIQEDGSFKMEILSRNENLITKEYIELMKDTSNYGSGAYKKLNHYIQLKPLTKYIISCKEYRELVGFYNILQFADYDHVDKVLGGFKYQSNHSGTSDIIFSNSSFTITTGLTGRIAFRMYINDWNNKDLVKRTIESIKELKIEEGNTKSFYIEGLSNKIQFSSIEPLRKWDRFVFKDGKLMIERNSKPMTLTRDLIWSLNATYKEQRAIQFVHRLWSGSGVSSEKTEVFCDKKPTRIGDVVDNGIWIYDYQTIVMQMSYNFVKTKEEFLTWLDTERPQVILKLAEPAYEEIPYDLQKIILEGYEKGTLFFDTNIPPTSTITYAGEAPIVSTIKDNKIDVSKNTEDINENIIPYLMDMDYRVTVLHLQSENISSTMNVSRVFGGVKEMLIRDIKSKRYSAQEYLNRISTYHTANKITLEEMEEIKSVVMEVYND